MTLNPTSDPNARPEAPMSDDTQRAAQLLREHRESIDRLDAILVYTLAERFKHTQAVGRLKAEHALPPSDPTREARQIERLEWLANEADPACATDPGPTPGCGCSQGPPPWAALVVLPLLLRRRAS